MLRWFIIAAFALAAAPALAQQQGGGGSVGLGSIATQSASSVAITGGRIDGTVVGGTTPATGGFSSLNDSATQSQTSGVNTAFSQACAVNPPSASTAVANCLGAASTYTGPGVVGTGGHIPVFVGHLINNSGLTLPLGIGVEGKIDNTSGTITSAESFNAQVASNPAGQTINAWYGEYCDVASNAGTIGIVGCLTPQIDSSTGTVTNFAGVYMQALTTHPSTLYGLYFAAQGGGTRYAVYNLDASAPIYSLGNITGASFTAGSTAGVSCSGSPTASFAVTNGIVTHC